MGCKKLIQNKTSFQWAIAGMGLLLDVSEMLESTTRIKTLNSSNFLPHWLEVKKESIIWDVSSCFVSCIPSLILLNVDIIFAVLSVISSEYKKHPGTGGKKAQSLTEPKWTKSQFECFVARIQPGEDINFYCCDLYHLCRIKKELYHVSMFTHYHC